MSVKLKALQAAAGNSGGETLYVEDVFSTYLYTGNASTQTITNGIDLEGEGGMVWLKSRSHNNAHEIDDTERGIGKLLTPNDASVQVNESEISAFNNDGFDLRYQSGRANAGGENIVSWTFRKARKFFDVVTYTGNSTPRTIAHNLGSVPGCMIVKRLDTTSSDWNVYHRSLGNSKRLLLNVDAQAYDVGDVCWNSITPTDSVFSLGTNSGVNANGSAYVAYLFAHDAGGFGDDGDQNIISCGSYTGNNGNPQQVELGYEPQWLLVKNATLGTAGAWWSIVDNMRGMSVAGNSIALIKANTSDAEIAENAFSPYATGFNVSNNNDFQNNLNNTYIYIAIRRGPMKTPESGTEVFAVSTALTSNQIATGFDADLWIGGSPSGDAGGSAQITMDRLRGPKYLATYGPAAELSTNNPFTTGPSYTFTNITQGGTTRVEWLFKRAPGFMDVVAYTGNSAASGTGNTQIINHNLGVAPEFIIVKRRTGASDWTIWHTEFNSASSYTYFDGSSELTSSPTYYFSTSGPQPTESQFTVGDAYYTNTSGNGYIAYLFATLPGVSKVGSYTGTGSDVNVDCGFSAGARFVLIKRIDANSTIGWFVYDSVRGIVSGNDPYLVLNSNLAQVTSTDYIDPYSAGFTVTSSAPADLNANGGKYFFLAIA